MFRNYFSSALSRILRNHVYTLINIGGLTIGIAGALLIFLFVSYEFSFDSFHKDRDRIYRLVSVPYKPGSGFQPSASVPLPVGEALRIGFTRLENVSSIFGRDAQISILKPNQQQEDNFDESGGIYFAETSFFQIFHFPWLYGDRREALSKPNSVVLTRSLAEKYFGNWHDAIGKTIRYDHQDIYRVNGILEDPPHNSDFPFKIVLPYSSLKHVDRTDWVGTYGRGYCFIKLPSNVDAHSFNLYLHELVRKHKPADHINDGIVLQPLVEMHRDAAFGNYNGYTFSRNLGIALLLVGLFLIIIACVNFTNLSTAQISSRSREIGVRKVLGSTRIQLVNQFFAETLVIATFSILLALALSTMILPFLNRLLGTWIVITLFDPLMILLLPGILIIVTLLAGLYPSLLSSKLSPIEAIRQKLSSKNKSGISLRRILVVTQFGISQAMIIAVFIMAGQMNYLHKAPLGFDKNWIVLLPLPGDSISQTKMEPLRQELLEKPGILNASFSTFSPLDNDYWNNYFKFDRSKEKTKFVTYFKWADASYFNTYHLEFVAGRPYGSSDTLKEWVVNETLVKNLGFQNPKDVLGKEISFWDKMKAPIVGVVKDFHTNSLQNPIVPVVIGAWKEAYQVASIKILPSKAASVLSTLEKLWKAEFPDQVYQYQFLDEKINDYYQSESKLTVLYKFFAGIAIFISCLGLYGLVSFMATQRVKEIGIRKVLGASSINIIFLFAKEFTILILLSFLIAAPLANYFMQDWLRNFSFRISPGFSLYILAIGGSVTIAWLTVAYKSFKAASRNPVIALRNE
jgi:ABC-type antimicrobial peptide transport system permease subunit